jgi:tRNA G10  N-methylase Trm11
MKSLFDTVPEKKYFFSHRDLPPSRSPFIRVKITLRCTAASLEELVQLLVIENITCDNFKFARFRIEDGELGYEKWMQSVTALGKVIHGEVDMKNPAIQFGTTLIDGLWIFGIYERNENPWEKHNLKPFTNSNSLETRIARSLVNIAVGQQVKTRFVDPCCGIGTVVLEALSLAIPVVGYEISWIIAKQAKQNVSFFGYENCIVRGDMLEIKEKYDVAILDIPYNLFSHVTYTQQKDIINASRRITNKLVLIACTDMDKDIISSGFTIVDRCRIYKGSFVRYVSVCF